MLLVVTSVMQSIYSFLPLGKEFYYYYYLVCWLTGCIPKQKPTVNSVIQCNSSKSDCVPVTGNAQLNL
jgi:hypothetical protein